MTHNINLQLPLIELTNTYKQAKPYKHILLEQFLPIQQSQKILETLKETPTKEKRNDLYHFYQTNDFQGEEGTLQELYTLFTSETFKQTIQNITNKQLQGIVDMAGTTYKEGNYLLCHTDKVEGRKIAYVYYLGEELLQGGEFALYNTEKNNPTNITKEITPKHNTLLLFEVTNNSYHEVKEVLLGTRYAISGWLQ